MFLPPVANYVTQFYPLGNTPAVSLTRALPQGVDGNILLLGCGDARNILFTAYSDHKFPTRKLDFTCCDISPDIIARNVFLFTLVVADESPIDSETAWKIYWKIYYDLYIDSPTSRLLQAHASNLVSLSKSLEAWHSSQYGALLAFCDETTMQLVRDCWERFPGALESKAKATYSKELQRSRENLKARLGADPIVMTSVRSASPVGFTSTHKIPDAFTRYWRHGSLTGSEASTPNPMFFTALSANTHLHYGTDPLSGFHLASALVKLSPDSPYRVKTSGRGSVDDLVRAAICQFGSWISAFKTVAKRNLKLRFVVSDALAFCHTLQHNAQHGTLSANLYRCQFDVSSCALDAGQYGPEGGAPRTFDAIDSSNLADHLGALNILVATKPLLKPAASSTIFLETLLKRGKTRQAEFEALLGGHAPTMSLVLGLTAVEHCTNATSKSWLDDLLLDTDSATQSLCRLSWKLTDFLHGPLGKASLPSMEPRALAGIFFNVYLRLFNYENPRTTLLSGDIMQGIQNSAYPHYVRGSIVRLIKHARASIQTDWSIVCGALVELITNDGSLILGNLYLQELLIQLHLHGLVAGNWLGDHRRTPNARGFMSWEQLPQALVVTLLIPRSRIDRIYEKDPLKASAPSLEGTVASGNSAWLNCFAAMHISFGTVKTSRKPEDDDFSVTVKQDPLGWAGRSPLVVSFYVPAVGLVVESRTAKIGLRIQQTIRSSMIFRHLGLGPMLTLYETTISDTSHVFVTKTLPGMATHPILCAGSVAPLPPADPNPVVTVNLDDTSTKVIALTGHLDVSTQTGKRLLADNVPITLVQSSPHTIDVVFGDTALVIPLTFPLPVVKERSKTRIARKSGYVEVVAPIAESADYEALSAYIWPTILGSDVTPVTLNSQHIDLDTLPALDLEETMNGDAEHWCSILVQSQFSARERKIRNTGLADPGAVVSSRVNFKDSLFTIFSWAAGLHGTQGEKFRLTTPGLGAVMLIFVRALRVDSAVGSVVADAAVLPLTYPVVRMPCLRDFFVDMSKTAMMDIKCNAEELRLWKLVLPALVERCRSWTHTSLCEYKDVGASVPLSLEIGEQSLCRCGNGKFPEDYMDLPKVVLQHMVRVAINPLFPVPFVEVPVDADMLSLSEKVQAMQVKACQKCGATKAAGSGGQLLDCGRCRKSSYCSRACQKADWKEHKVGCGSP